MGCEAACLIDTLDPYGLATTVAYIYAKRRFGNLSRLRESLGVLTEGGTLIRSEPARPCHDTHPQEDLGVQREQGDHRGDDCRIDP